VPVDVILPMLGETMDEATIVQWLVRVGEPVKKGEPLFQVETDKAILDVNSPADGILASVEFGEGSKVPVLSVVGRVALVGEALTTRRTETPEARHVEREPQAATVVSQAAPRRAISPRARKLAADAGLDVAAVEGTGPAGRIVEKDVQRAIAQMQAAPPRVAATPLARKAAARAGIELQRVRGTGPGGRIVLADLSPKQTAGDTALSATSRQGKVTSTPVTGVRKIIAERMAASSAAAAAVTLVTEADATELAHVRNAVRERHAADGVTFSYTDLLVWIVARALRDMPYMNARLVGNEIEQHDSINIGVAVDTERGLLVPVIRGAGEMNVVQLAKALRELVQRARSGKSLPDDLTGGTFTITNLGMYEIDSFTPLINLPECAILGIGRLNSKPVVRDEQISVRTMVTFSLTFDHRVIDGAPAARFLQRIKVLVEQPTLMLV